MSKQHQIPIQSDAWIAALSKKRSEKEIAKLLHVINEYHVRCHRLYYKKV